MHKMTRYEIVCEIREPVSDQLLEHRIMAIAPNEEAAKAIVYSLQRAEEDPNTDYYYSDVEE